MIVQNAEALIEEFTAPILPDLQADLDFHATAQDRRFSRYQDAAYFFTVPKIFS